MRIRIISACGMFRAGRLLLQGVTQYEGGVSLLSTIM